MKITCRSDTTTTTTNCIVQRTHLYSSAYSCAAGTIQQRCGVSGADVHAPPGPAEAAACDDTGGCLSQAKAPCNGPAGGRPLPAQQPVREDHACFCSAEYPHQPAAIPTCAVHQPDLPRYAYFPLTLQVPVIPTGSC